MREVLQGTRCNPAEWRLLLAAGNEWSFSFLHLSSLPSVTFVLSHRKVFAVSLNSAGEARCEPAAVLLLPASWKRSVLTEILALRASFNSIVCAFRESSSIWAPPLRASCWPLLSAGQHWVLWGGRVGDDVQNSSRSWGSWVWWEGACQCSVQCPVTAQWVLRAPKVSVELQLQLLLLPAPLIDSPQPVRSLALHGSVFLFWLPVLFSPTSYFDLDFHLRPNHY